MKEVRYDEINYVQIWRIMWSFLKLKFIDDLIKVYQRVNSGCFWLIYLIYVKFCKIEELIAKKSTLDESNKKWVERGAYLLLKEEYDNFALRGWNENQTKASGTK